MFKEKPSGILLDRGKGTTLTVRMVGAVITSWRVNNEEKLFVPVTAEYSRYSRARGGITLSFPYYPLCETKEVYELSRLYEWMLCSGPTTLENGDIRLTLLMKDDEWTRANWPYSFLFFYIITLKKRSIKLDTRILNTTPLETIAFRLHVETYFQIENIADYTIDGLLGESYCDKLDTSIPYLNEYRVDRGEQQIARARIYYSPVENVLFLMKKRDPCEARNDGETYRKYFKFRRKNFPDVSIRYPWCLPEPYSDVIPPDRLTPEYNRDALCVGAGHVTDLKKLKPETMYKSTVVVSIIAVEKEAVSMAQLEEPLLFRECPKPTLVENCDQAELLFAA